MAETYRTEEEQVEAIKKWWKENGTSTVVSIVIAIVAVFGWQGWQKSQQQNMDTASGIYSNLITAATSADGTLSDEKKATARHLADTLKEDFSGSTYAQFAALYKARFAVEDNDLDSAEAELRWVLDKGASEELASQATLRLARVLAAKEDYDQALQLLDGNSAGMAGAYAQVKGDIYSARGEIDNAIQAYENAKELGQQQEPPQPDPLLDMKLQQLKSERGSVAANRAKEG